MHDEAHPQREERHCHEEYPDRGGQRSPVVCRGREEPSSLPPARPCRRCILIAPLEPAQPPSLGGTGGSRGVVTMVARLRNSMVELSSTPPTVSPIQSCALGWAGLRWTFHWPASSGRLLRCGCLGRSTPRTPRGRRELGYRARPALPTRRMALSSLIARRRVERHAGFECGDCMINACKMLNPWARTAPRTGQSLDVSEAAANGDRPDDRHVSSPFPPGKA